MPAFLLAPLTQYLVYGLLILAVVGFIFGSGWKEGSDHVQTKWDAAVTTGALRTVRVIEYRDRWRTKKAAEFRADAAAITTTVEELKKESAHEAESRSGL